MHCMDALQPDYYAAAPADARASVERHLKRHYRELGGEPDAPPFSLARMLRARAYGLPLTGREDEVTHAAALAMGQMADPHRAWVPLQALGVRAMSTSSGPQGGYAVAGTVLEPADILRPWSVTAQAGVQVLPNLKGDCVLPRLVAAAAAGWLGEANAGISFADPVLGNVSLRPRTGVALVKFSQQLLKQGEAAEVFVRMMLLRAIGQLVDEAFFNGPGGAAPLGLLSTSGTTAQDGSNLARAGLLAMRKAVIAAGAREEALRWVGTQAGQETLAGRHAVADTFSPLWDDAGRILGLPAHATPHAVRVVSGVTTHPLVAGDFSTSVLGIFGPGVRIDIDPSQDFESAGLVARVLLFADIAHPRPEAFAVAASVT